MASCRVLSSKPDLYVERVAAVVELPEEGDAVRGVSCDSAAHAEALLERGTNHGHPLCLAHRGDCNREVAPTVLVTRPCTRLAYYCQGSGPGHKRGQPHIMSHDDIRSNETVVSLGLQ